MLIDNAVWLYGGGSIDTAVIVAPKGVYRNWETSEIPAQLYLIRFRTRLAANPSPNKTQAKRLGDGVEERGVLRYPVGKRRGICN